MTFKDILKEANTVLNLNIDWENTVNDSNYNNLLDCAKLRFNVFYGGSVDEDTIVKDVHHLIVYNGIIAEWAFINGHLLIWKEYETKYNMAMRGL